MRPSSPWCNAGCIRPALHPFSTPTRVPRWGPRAWLRCSSLKCSRHSRSSRLASRGPQRGSRAGVVDRAHHRPRCHAGVAPRAASVRCATRCRRPSICGGEAGEDRAVDEPRRARGDWSTGPLAWAITEAIGRVDRDIAISFTPLKLQVDAALVQERIIAMLSGFFGGLATLLQGIFRRAGGDQEWIKRVEQGRNTNRETVAQPLHTGPLSEGTRSGRSFQYVYIPQ